MVKNTFLFFEVKSTELLLIFFTCLSKIDKILGENSGKCG